MEKMDTVNAPTEFKPRKPWLAGLMSLFPSLGQVYNGQLKKGIFIFGSLLLVPYLFGILRLKLYFWAYFGLILFLIAIRIYAVTDAVMVANRQKEYVPKKYNVWYCYVLVMLLCIVPSLTNLPNNLSVQSLRIYSLSGSPTLQINEMVIADYNAYKNTKPDYGDLVVFKVKGDISYGFRVVGLPHDTIDIKDNLVSINKRRNLARFIQKAYLNKYTLLEYQETLPNGHNYSIYRNESPYDSAMANIQNIIVPAESYFLLGDNRDLAYDSRYIGSVNINKIQGKILYNAWSNDLKRINIDFTKK